MKARLMFADRSFDPDRVAVPDQAAELEQDLGLSALWDTMGGGDEVLRKTARAGLLAGLKDPEAIRYRQAVLRDCLSRPEVVQELYEIADTAITGERHVYGGTVGSPGATLSRSVQVLELFLPLLARLHRVAVEHAHSFTSAGFGTCLATLSSELDAEYLADVREHLQQLQFRHGVLFSAGLAAGNESRDFVLHRPSGPAGVLQRIREGIRLDGGGPAGYSYRVPEWDDSEGQALSTLRDRGLDLAADAAARSAEHILGFFRMLRTELGFYLACRNLHQRLTALGMPVCFPDPVVAGPVPTLVATRLYDPSLALTLHGPVVGNDVDAGRRRMLVVTGANRGGKTTFLRSVGVAQLMMHAGMFVPAVAFRSSVADGVFTHFLREDAGMDSGRFDEELARMSSIVGRIAPSGLLLCNESFSSTNEREGSQIAREVIDALLDAGVRVAIVTHLYELAHGWYADGDDRVLFLRAERGPAGERRFRLSPGEPLPTSYGRDLYPRILGSAG